MNRKTLLATALAAGSLMGLATVAQAAPAVVAGTPGAPAYSYTGQTIVMQTAPPAPMYEAVPSPREGYLWAPGHWVWDNGRYTWQSGHWMSARPGYAWQAPHWQQRSDGSWYLVGGTWVRNDSVAYDRRMERGPNGDMDHDGIRNADDDDRDGDGVANWDDDFPSNPNRS
jgi:hypothetical protein